MRLSSGKNGILEIPSLLNRKYGKLVKFFTVFCFENRKKAGKITSVKQSSDRKKPPALPVASQTVKKVRNRQNQSTNKRRFTESED